MVTKSGHSSKKSVSATISRANKKPKEDTTKVSLKERSFLSTNTSGLGSLIGKLLFILFLPFRVLRKLLRWYMGLFKKIPFGRFVSVVVLVIVIIGSWFLYDWGRFTFMEYRIHSLAERIAEDLKPTLGEYTTSEEKSCNRGRAAYGEYGDYGCSYYYIVTFSNKNSADISNLTVSLFKSFEKDESIQLSIHKTDSFGFTLSYYPFSKFPIYPK